MILSFYITFPLLYTGFLYIFGIDRNPIVAIIFHILVALFVAIRLIKIFGLLNLNFIDLSWGVFLLILIINLTFRVEFNFYNAWLIFSYVILPYLIGRTLYQGVGKSIVIMNTILLSLIFIYLTWDLSNQNEQGERNAVFGDPSNSIALSLFLAFIFSFLISIKIKKHNKIYFFMLFIILVALAALFSPRWFLLALFIILIIKIMVKGWDNYELKIIFGSVVVATAMIFASNRINFYFTNGLMELYESISNPDSRDSSIAERVSMFSNGINLFLENILFGVGLGQYGNVLNQDEKSFPHFSFIQVIAELGMLGGVLWMTLIIITLSKLVCHVKSDTRNFPFLSIFLFGLIFSVFHGNYLTDRLIYLAAGYISFLQNNRINKLN